MLKDHLNQPTAVLGQRINEMDYGLYYGLCNYIDGGAMPI